MSSFVSLPQKKKGLLTILVKIYLYVSEDFHYLMIRKRKTKISG